MIAIAIIIILAGMGFMAVVSSELVTSATTMASVLILVALLAIVSMPHLQEMGIAAASRASREA